MPFTRIQEVIDRLSELIDRSRIRRSRVGYFAALYRRITADIRAALESGDFADPVLRERARETLGHS